MPTLVDTLGWFALFTVLAALAWLYGSSWRAVAEALGEAEQRADQNTNGHDNQPTRLAA